MVDGPTCVPDLSSSFDVLRTSVEGSALPVVQHVPQQRNGEQRPDLRPHRKRRRRDADNAGCQQPPTATLVYACGQIRKDQERGRQRDRLEQHDSEHASRAIRDRLRDFAEPLVVDPRNVLRKRIRICDREASARHGVEAESEMPPQIGIHARVSADEARRQESEQASRCVFLSHRADKV